MVPLVALVNILTRDETVDEATKAGTRILAAFGVPGPFTTGRVQEFQQSGLASYDIEIAATGGVRFGITAQKTDGHCQIVERKGWYSGGIIPPRPAIVRERRLQTESVVSALRRAFGDTNVGSGVLQEQGLQDKVYVPKLVDGYPILGEGSYLVTLDAQTGKFLQLYDDIPPFAHDKVEHPISERRAAHIAEKAIGTRPPRRPTQWYVERTTLRLPSQSAAYVDAEHRLGWYRLTSNQARLTWRIPFFWRWRTSEDTHSWQFPGTGVIIVDAENGSLIHPPKFDEEGKPIR